MYFLEGNIGAGKSTLLTAINKKLPTISVLFEPVQSWQKQAQGQSLLADFYKEPKRWAYTLETFVALTRVKDHINEQCKADKTRIIERSIFTGHYCFAKNDYINGYMSEIEWNVYNQVFNFLITGKCALPKGFIYLKTEPVVSLERVKKRNRNGESTISLDYLKEVHDRHEEFLIQRLDLSKDLKAVPVLVLDGNVSFEDDAILNEYLNKIELFVNQ